MPDIQGIRPHDKQEEVSPVINSSPGILGLSSVLNHLEVLNSEGETPKDTAQHSPPPATDHSVPEEDSKVDKESNSQNEDTPSSPLHYRAIQKLVNSVSPSILCQSEVVEKFNTHVQLSKKVRIDLTWWAGLERGAPIPPPSPTLVLTLDAFSMGWGASNVQQKTGGLWSLVETAHHINYLELLAMFLALKAFAKDLKQLHYPLQVRQCHSNDLSESERGTHSRRLALEIWEWCLDRGITTMAEHLPRSDNITAD